MLYLSLRYDGHQKEELYEVACAKTEMRQRGQSASMALGNNLISAHCQCSGPRSALLNLPMSYRWSDVSEHVKSETVSGVLYSLE